jgi:hypothetical protein
MMEILELLDAESYIHIISIDKFMSRISDSHRYERIQYCNINKSILYSLYQDRLGIVV